MKNKRRDQTKGRLGQLPKTNMVYTLLQPSNACMHDPPLESTLIPVYLYYTTVNGKPIEPLYKDTQPTRIHTFNTHSLPLKNGNESL